MGLRNGDLELDWCGLQRAEGLERIVVILIVVV